MDSTTVRILQLDGGGTRGYTSLIFIKEFCRLMGISEKDFLSGFDIICGTSIGGIQACAYAFGLTPSDIEDFFTIDARNIFTIRDWGDYLKLSDNASTTSNRPNGLQMIKLMLNNDPFYKSISETSNYGHARLKSKLKEVFGTNTLKDLKQKVLISSYEYDTQTPVIFSNYVSPEYIGHPTIVDNLDGTNSISGFYETIVNVCMATSAAPVYLPEAVFNGRTYIDGGIYINNLSSIACSLGKQIKPFAKRTCLLSIGTGLSKIGFYTKQKEQESFSSSIITNFFNYLFSSSVINWVEIYRSLAKIKNLIEIATTGSQEAVAFANYITAKYNVNFNDTFHYYRYQPILDSSKDWSLDNTDPEFFIALKQVAIDIVQQQKNELKLFYDKWCLGLYTQPQELVFDDPIDVVQATS